MQSRFVNINARNTQYRDVYTKEELEKEAALNNQIIEKMNERYELVQKIKAQSAALSQINQQELNELGDAAV